MPVNFASRPPAIALATTLSFAAASLSALSVLSILCPSDAVAQDFPTRPLTIVVPYPPGSATDIVARLFQPKLAEALKQNVIIENRGGASTNIGTEYVARAPADGHTILVQVPNLATNEFAYANLRWKKEDFAPIGSIVRWSNVLFAGPSAPVRDFRQLLAQKGPPQYYGSPGPGSLSHIAVESLKARTGLALEHVTYTGVPPMVTSLLGGHIQYGATNPANFMSHVKEGKHKLTPMVVLGSQRDSTIPDVPCLADLGVRGVEAYGWMAVLVPAKTPPAVVERLNVEFMKVLRMPDIQEKLKANYLEPFPSTPDEFAKFLQAESRKWGDAIKAAGIKPE